VSVTYLPLQVADQQAIEDLARLVAVSNVFEGFGRVLAADIEHYFLTAPVIYLLAAWKTCAGREMVGRR